jgi:hypothetical protein
VSGFKYQIDPYRQSSRKTLCNNLRALYRRLEQAGDAEGMRIVAESFSWAKAMDHRLKYYRNAYEPHRKGPEVDEADT